MQKHAQKLINIRLPNFEHLNHASIQQAVQSAEAQLANRGRVLLRPSGTEPVMRVMVEGEDEQQVDKLANELAKVVKEAAQ